MAAKTPVQASLYFPLWSSRWTSGRSLAPAVRVDRTQTNTNPTKTTPPQKSLALNWQAQTRLLLFLSIIFWTLIAVIHFLKKFYLKTADTLRSGRLRLKSSCDVSSGLSVGWRETGWRTDITQDCPASSSSLWWSCCPAAVNFAIWTSTTTSCRFMGGGLWLWGAGAQLKRAPTRKSHDAFMVNQFQILVKTKIILLCDSDSTTTHLPLKHTGNYWLLLTSTTEASKSALLLVFFWGGLSVLISLWLLSSSPKLS